MKIERTYFPVPDFPGLRGIEYRDLDTGQCSIAHMFADKSELSAIISGSLAVESDPLGIWEEKETMA